MGSTKNCAAVGCPNRIDENLLKEISFHSFPFEIVRRTEWLLAINRIDWIPTTQSVLCSEHFRPEDLEKSSTNVRLQRYAIPSILSHQPASIQKNYSAIMEQSLRKILRFRNKSDNELEKLNQKMKDPCTQPNMEDEDVQIHTCSVNRKRKRCDSKPSREKIVPLKMNNNSQIVMKPKPCVTTPDVHLLTEMQQNDQLNLKSNRRGRKRKPIPENSKPKEISLSELRAFGGLSAPLTAEATNDGLIVSQFGYRKKMCVSLLIVVKPHLNVKELKESERMPLDTHVKSILSYAPKEFTEWLIKQGLLKSSQICICHPSAQLKLTLTDDVTSFPYSGGYLWYSDCCPDEIVSVYNGSLFESSPYPPSEILKLIYYWSCQTNYKDMLELVKVDNSYMRMVNSRLRAICAVALQTDVGLFGGPGKKVEIGMMATFVLRRLPNRNERVPAVMLGVLDSETKQIHLRILDLNFKLLPTILDLLSHWIHPESIIAIDKTLDKDKLFNGGFTDIQQSMSSDQKPCNESIMKYLREILTDIFGNKLPLITIDVIQEFLIELVWRERFGTTPLECFNNIMSHISQQTDRFTNLIRRLIVVSIDPLKNWKPKKK